MRLYSGSSLLARNRLLLWLLAFRTKWIESSLTTLRAFTRKFLELHNARQSLTVFTIRKVYALESNVHFKFWFHFLGFVLSLTSFMQYRDFHTKATAMTRASVSTELQV
jgi:hypothetical protein